MPDPKAPPKYPTHRENFDVVMLKKGSQAHTAAPEDFRRVRVTAESPFAARTASEVAAAEGEGWTSLDVIPPGGVNEYEHAAQGRGTATAAVDRRTGERNELDG